MAEDDGIDHLVRRYLGAFGPAPPRDIASWMGVLPRMDLVTRRDEDGKPLLDLPDATVPDPDTPAPPRFIGVWEAMLLVHARRTGLLPEEQFHQVGRYEQDRISQGIVRLQRGQAFQHAVG